MALYIIAVNRLLQGILAVIESTSESRADIGITTDNIKSLIAERYLESITASG